MDSGPNWRTLEPSSIVLLGFVACPLSRRLRLKGLAAVLLVLSGTAFACPEQGSQGCLGELQVTGGGDQARRQVIAVATTVMDRLKHAFKTSSFDIRVGLEAPLEAEACPARAFAAFVRGRGLVGIHFDDDWSEATLARIVAHEIAHLFHFDQIKSSEGPSGDAILKEGLATWLAEPEWLAGIGYESFQQAVNVYREDGRYLGLAEYYDISAHTLMDTQEACYALRDMQYTQWAGFVGFLIEHYGMDAVIAASAQPRILLPGAVGSDQFEPVDYLEAFGASISELETRWLLELSQGDQLGE